MIYNQKNSISKSNPNYLKFSHFVGVDKTIIKKKSKPIFTILEKFTELTEKFTETGVCPYL